MVAPRAVRAQQVTWVYTKAGTVEGRFETSLLRWGAPNPKLILRASPCLQNSSRSGRFGSKYPSTGLPAVRVPAGRGQENVSQAKAFP